MSPRGETVYGHAKRYRWIREHLKQQDRILEFGCGTGVMITLPLLVDGYDIIGVDRDQRSISYGREQAVAMGVAETRLRSGDLPVEQAPFDVIIVSEVLEHLHEDELERVLSRLHDALVPGGILLVTVPNGFGWFELEAWIWNRLKFGALLSWSRLDRSLMRLKVHLTGKPEEELVEVHPSSFDSSPHVQRFTPDSLTRVLASAGFERTGFAGSSVFAGQISNLLFTGYDKLMGFNARLADRCPRLAAGFFFSFNRRDRADSVAGLKR